MCIAVYSPEGIPVPLEETLYNCFVTNPDGAGFSFNYNNAVHTYKGFFRFDDFYQTLSECDRKYALNECGVLIHFRIATHGSIDTGNCHPFALSDKESKLRASYTKSDYAVVHNGICKITSSRSKKEQLSDTALFVRDYLSKIACYKGWFSNPQTPSLIYKLIDSKMAILKNNGKIIATEGFHRGEDGNYYSNFSYLGSRCGYYDYGWTDWDIPVYHGKEPVPLMQLQKGEAICYSDGTLEEYSDSYHRYFPTFVSEDAEIYTAFNGMESIDNIAWNDLSYVGEGAIINPNSPFTDEGICPLPFRGDVIVRQ